MSLSGQITCDACGRIRGEANHWWLLWRRDDGFFLSPRAKSLYFKIPSIVVMPWREPFATSGVFHQVVQHACGWQCVAILQSRWMEKTAEAEKVGAEVGSGN